MGVPHWGQGVSDDLEATMLHYTPAYDVNGPDFHPARRRSFMSFRRPLIGTIVLLLVLASLQGCDFRQITEDRPVKLPAESTEPKEVHPAETGQGSDRTPPTRKQ